MRYLPPFLTTKQLESPIVEAYVSFVILSLLTHSICYWKTCENFSSGGIFSGEKISQDNQTVRRNIVSTGVFSTGVFSRRRVFFGGCISVGLNA